MKFFVKLQIALLLGAMVRPALAHGPVPVSLRNVPVPPVPGLLDGGDPIVVDKNAAIALGKALFWDTNLGSDGMACGSCHFHAGADGRVKNQINPGAKSTRPSGQTFDTLASGGGGPNHTLSLSDFPLHQLSNPADQFSDVISTTDDVVASSGTFSGTFKGSSRLTGGNDDCARGADPVFNVNHVGTRRVEPRNAPTVINSVFNFRNFWDGRANNIFNGSSPWGDRDPDAGVWVKLNARSVEKQKLRLVNSSLASLATGPALSDTEMSCQKRKWSDIGRKLLQRQPLQNQKVHPEDSVLGPLSLSSAGNLKPGLNTTYKNLIIKAFNAKYWAFSGTGPFGAPTGQTPYSQMEANFSMFFGLALQLYQSTLISDQSPFDLSPLNAQLRPTWTNVNGATPAETTALRASLTRGNGVFFNNHCNLCHTGPTMSLAALASSAALLTPTEGKTFGPDATPIAYGPNAFGPNNAVRYAGLTRYVNVVTRDYAANTTPTLMDLGFVNTGVADPDDDPGVGGVDDFGNPLSFSAQYVNYVLGETAGIKDNVVTTTRACDFLAGFAVNTSYVSPSYFTTVDDLIADGSKEGVLRNVNCADPAWAYLPSVAAARAAVGGPKLAVATYAAFKVPTLRNIELTGPYMHNGGMATLEQVIEFYTRHGNFYNDNLHEQINTIASDLNTATNRADLIAFLKSFTDERVRYQKAPFDHPEVVVPNGHVGDAGLVTAGNPLLANFAKDEVMVVPAVGASGSTEPTLRFDQLLAQ